nr:xylulose kinase-1 [Tanacetum cinerariifolium]
MIKVLPPKTAEDVMAREREKKARTTLLIALPEDHLEKFHKMANTKKMWEAIKSRFGGDDDLKARDNDAQNYAMMAYSSSNSGFDNETSIDESDSKPSEYASYESDSSIETTTSMPKPIDNAPKVVCEPKVWTDAPIIEEHESDSDDDSVFNAQEEKEKPSFAFINTAKHVKTSRENVKESGTPNHSPNIRKQGRTELASPKQTALGKDISNPFMAGSLPKTIRVLALKQSKAAQDLVIKTLQKKVKRIERKIKARTSGMTLFKIGNFRRKSLDKENVSKQERYLKIRSMFEESDFDNIDDLVDEDND